MKRRNPIDDKMVREDTRTVMKKVIEKKMAAEQAGPKSPTDTPSLDGRQTEYAPAPRSGPGATEPAHQKGSPDNEGKKYKATDPETKSPINESIVTVGSNKYRIL